MKGYIAILALIIGCKSQLNTTASDTPKESEPEELIITTNTNQTPRPDEIPAGNALIVAEIVEVSTTETDSKFPCSEHPCRATIKVNEVLGYGHSFQGNLQKGASIEAYFPFTLSPSSQVFPDKEMPSTPGLKAGDRFQANVKSVPVLGGQVSYEIRSYELK